MDYKTNQQTVNEQEIFELLETKGVDRQTAEIRIVHDDVVLWVEGKDRMGGLRSLHALKESIEEHEDLSWWFRKPK